MNLPLENQVCSLDLAKRLKELGVKQESVFYWKQEAIYYWQKLDNKDLVSPSCFSAFTVAELGEMFPGDLNGSSSFNGESTEYESWGNRAYSYRDEVYEKQNGGKWACTNDNNTEYANTEADARAKCLIYLLENKLIKL